ncbi:hypothetical protein DSCW_14070 [Desulfosarcina widdelii]|uniref:histidine kinase n=1 Tax=Desulfosarcina widdelii TaxID=947919 RepID=A0A5K7Z019_9BACT|nr:PAS domain-containing protein [Desulfosarcina widdelii]BBO73990.1 hypothetical protein DSCW_14070 [Desulfosarcina widdelii]
MVDLDDYDIYHDRALAAERYKRLVENSLDIVYIFSNKRGGLYWSPRVKEVLGYEPADLKKNSFLWYDSIHPDFKENIDSSINQFSKGRGHSIEYKIIDTSGKWHWLLDRFIGKVEKGDEIIIEGLATDITVRKNLEIELEEKNAKLEKAMAEVKTLRGIIPICSNCKKIRTDKGAWDEVELYISRHSDALFSHSICPKCKKLLYPDFD